MCKVNLLWIILSGMFCSVEGQNFTISANFKDGNVTFRWLMTKNKKSDIKIKLGNSNESGWIKSDESYMYRVDNVLIYESVRIKVRDDRSVMRYPGGFQDYNMTYTVSLVESKIGDSKNISWTLSYFPKGGSYNIYHLKAKLKNILTISFGGQKESSKYISYRWPYNSTNIAFGVNDIQPSDAGFYTGATSKFDTASMGGVVLVVHNKPTKPEIKGNLNVPINTQATLTCSSKSTSVPEYYSRIAAWRYSWFINNTILIEGNTKIYRINVTKDVKYNTYSCQSLEHFKSIEEGPSDQSDPVRINPLYGPSRITITSLKFKQGKLTVREGEQIRQFNCTADCNPPCTLRWQYVSLNGSIRNAESIGGTLEDQRAKRDMASFQCVAQWNANVTKTQPVKLNIQYISDPKFYLNGSGYISNFLIRKEDRLELSCHGEGNPTPSISVTKIPDLTMPGQSGNGWFNYTFQTLNCSNTGTYNCKGNSFDTKETNITINVTCTLRIDTSEHFKSIYGSMSGPNVTLKLRVPVISNPPPSAQEISWKGPGIFTKRSQSLEPRENVAYKHWILSTIPVKNKTYFGNYTMKYRGRDITTITINAEDKPEPPLNFSWYSYAAGFINLTWVSNFNGGPEQFFILSRKEGSNWTIVKNLPDPGAGKMGYHDLGPLTPGQEYLYQLDSCNRINCSLSPKEVTVNVEAPPILSSTLFGDNTMLILVGASAAGFLLVVVLTLAVTMYCKTTKKSATKKRNREERLTTVQDDSPADAVVYAAVDKSVLMKNRQQDDVVKSDVIKDQNDDNDTMYSEVIKHPKKQQTDEKIEKKKNEEKESKENNEEAGASTSNDNSRSTNQDGLVYIDVEFARKPPSSDTKGRPFIHGEEEKTEYTFVDFSQKAPPVKKTQENVK